jgi:hypothetical protein
MDNNEALSALHEAQGEMIMWADIDPETQPVYDRFKDAVAHVDAALSSCEQDMMALTVLAGKVAAKLQIPYEDAKGIVMQIIGEDYLAGIICGLALEIP